MSLTATAFQTFVWSYLPCVERLVYDPHSLEKLIQYIRNGDSFLFLCLPIQCTFDIVCCHCSILSTLMSFLAVVHVHILLHSPFVIGSGEMTFELDNIFLYRIYSSIHMSNSVVTLHTHIKILCRVKDIHKSPILNLQTLFR